MAGGHSMVEAGRAPLKVVTVYVLPGVMGNLLLGMSELAALGYQSPSDG